MFKTPLRLLLVFLIALMMPTALGAAPLPEETPTVRAVLFWLNTCPHCHDVIEDTLPPLEEKYGAQLDLRLLELHTQADFQRLYALAAAYGVPQSGVGVPLLLIADQILIGGGEIPARLPGLIDQYLAAGGVDFPAMPGFSISQTKPFEVDARVRPNPTSVSGFGLAMVVMAGMVLALIYTGGAALNKVRWLPAEMTQWALPMLAIIGLGVSAYMAYVETQEVTAICGPIGDCNTVQGSDYAKLFGVLPIGILGLIGYGAILALWGWPRLRQDDLAKAAPKLLFGLAVAGVLFSIYLTYLEPFVIGAVCMWCLSSAVIMTLLLLVTITPALKPIPVVKGRKRRNR
ncbi:MAG: hypothetical protein KF893_26975 [Caldilineaceae bacterium]|nr:hypothetical protein [Caldilineaceae bacterium]